MTFFFVLILLSLALNAVLSLPGRPHWTHNVAIVAVTAALSVSLVVR
jgi:hypothetical protein